MARFTVTVVTVTPVTTTFIVDASDEKHARLIGEDWAIMDPDEAEEVEHPGEPRFQSETEGRRMVVESFVRETE